MITIKWYKYSEAKLCISYSLLELDTKHFAILVHKTIIRHMITDDSLTAKIARI